MWGLKIAMWLHYTEKVLQGGTASVYADTLKKP